MRKLKLFLLAVISLLVTATNAQNPALKIPKFKGMEITGTVDQFGSKLAGQGFTFLSKEDNTAIYQGRFAGQDDCLLYLYPVENSNDIASVFVVVGVNFSDFGTIYSYETWEQLIKDYDFLKNLLTEKYGTPVEQNEGFQRGAYTSSSHLKLEAVKEGQCDYYATWGDEEVDKMVVKLMIVGGSNMGERMAAIAIGYSNVDKTNAARREILDDL